MYWVYGDTQSGTATRSSCCSTYWRSSTIGFMSISRKWQFFEQYSHKPFIATARFINKYLDLPEERRQEY